MRRRMLRRLCLFRPTCQRLLSGGWAMSASGALPTRPNRVPGSLGGGAVADRLVPGGLNEVHEGSQRRREVAAAGVIEKGAGELLPPVRQDGLQRTAV